MSLIDEALKRARLEAAQRAAESEGMPYPTIPRHLTPRQRRAWLMPVAVALAVIAGLLVGLMLASRGGPTAEQLASLGGGETAAALPLTSGLPTPEEAGRDPVLTGSKAPARGGSAGSEELSRETETPEPAAEVTPVERAPDDRQAVAPPAIEPAPPARPAIAAPPPTTTMVTDPDSGVLLVLPERASQSAADSAVDAVAESYVQEYPLPNGSAIELGGIAWSETGPFALINGRVVGPGSIIEDHTLERIRPGHVILTGAGRRIRLSLR